MKLNILYNFPMGQSSVSAELGMSNVKDKDSQFRLGISDRKEKNKVKWIEPDWVDEDEVSKLKSGINSNLILWIQKRNKETLIIESSLSIDLTETWPPEAVGSSITSIDYFI